MTLNNFFKKNKKINVLHIDYDDLDNSFGSGGQALCTRELYKNIRRDVNVTVLTGNYPGAKNINIDGISYKRLGVGSYGPIISIISFWLMIPFAVWRLQGTHDLIVEFFTAPFSLPLGFIAARKPYFSVATFFGAKELSKKYHFPFYVLENFGLKMINNFLVPTKHIKGEIQKVNPNANITVMSYGYENGLQKQKTKELPYALFLGRIDIYNKGLDILVAAWKEVIKEQPDIKLYIAGKGKQKDENLLKNLIENNGMSNSIMLIGKLTGKKKFSIVANCMFVVVPSRFETFCQSALEAMAIGKPVITSDIKGLSWIPSDSSLRFKSEHVPSLVNKCLDMTKDSLKRRQIGKAGKSFAKKYTWKSISEIYRAFLVKYLSENKELTFNSNKVRKDKIQFAV